jgi:predicted transcriptional regulator
LNDRASLQINLKEGSSLMSPMNRRLLVAAILVLAGLAGSAATAMAQADRFGTPAVQPGDRWLYNATNATPQLVPYHPDYTWTVDKVSLQAGPEAHSIDGAGVRHAGRQFDEVRQYRIVDDDPDPTLFAIRAWHVVEGPQTVATAMTWPRGGGSATNHVILPNGQEILSRDEQVKSETVVDFGVSSRLCGSSHDLQGARRPVDQPVLLHGACGLWDGSDSSIRLDHTGETTWQRRPVQTYGNGVGNGTIEAWFDPAIPVPVRLRVGVALFELAGYESAALPSAYAFPVHDVPAVTFAPRDGVGPDETGVDHPFPLSLAYSAALADPDSGLTAYLEEHPGAQLVAASFEELIDQTTRPNTEFTSRWTFTASDGASAHGVQSDLVRAGPASAPRILTPVAPPPDLLPPSSPYPKPVQDQVQRFEAIPVDPVPGPWPAAGDLPTELPTVASLLARWEAYKDEGRGAGNAWGFAPDCAAGSCAGGGWRMWAGLSRTTTPSEAGVTLASVYTQEPEGSTVEVDGEGRTVDHREVTMTRKETFAELRVPGTPSASSSPSARAALSLASLPAQATAIGAFATLAAVVVLAWPWLKASGPFALFSRVTGDKVLDSPRRATLLALVEAEPGIHLRELARRTGQAEGALRHHLARLQEAGKVRAVRGPRYLCYFPVGAAAAGIDRDVAAVAPLLKSDVARRLLERCAAEPGLSGQRLAADLGVTPGAVTYHVQRLSAAGLLSQRRLGREQLVDVTPLGRAAV